MTPQAQSAHHMKTLEGLLEEYIGWFHDVGRAIFYPAKVDYHKIQIRPEDFADWVRTVEDAGVIEPGSLLDLHNLLDDLIRQAGHLMHDAHQKEKSPPFEDYDRLLTYFEEFILKARRFERDALLEDSGIDPTTGLRSPALIEKDVRRELDRLERQGKTFSLALVQINQFDRLVQLLPPREAEEALMRVVDLIKRNLRSFDDAYYLGNGLFAMCLKQTSQLGATKALARMKNELEEMNTVHNLDGIRTVLSLLSCVTEPVPENNINELISGLKEQLVKGGAGESIVQYQEMSALERFLHQGKT